MWRKLAPEMRRLGLLTELDRPLFETYCMLYGQWRACNADIQEHGTTYRSESGQEKSRPEMQLLLALTTQLRQIGAEFGLSPASRTKVSVSPPSPEMDREAAEWAILCDREKYKEVYGDDEGTSD